MDTYLILRGSPSGLLIGADTDCLVFIESVLFFDLLVSLATLRRLISSEEHLPS